jgi:hypothetical protein
MSFFLGRFLEFSAMGLICSVLVHILGLFAEDLLSATLHFHCSSELSLRPSERYLQLSCSLIREVRIFGGEPFVPARDG